MTPLLIKARVRMIELGIAPAVTGLELSQMLSTMSEKEKRKAKRKFRKQWKKILKADQALCNTISFNPSLSDKAVKRNRCVLVASSIIKSCS